MKIKRQYGIYKLIAEIAIKFHTINNLLND